MPRVSVPVTVISRAGVAPAAEVTGDPTNNHALANDGETVLLARNAGATVARTVSLVIQTTIDGQSTTPKTVSVPATESRYIGPFPVNLYGSEVHINVDNAELRLSAYKI